MIDKGPMRKVRPYREEMIPEVLAAGRRPSLGIVDGLNAFAGGVGFVVSTPSVWVYALVPAVMVLVLACGLGALGIWGAVRTGHAVFEDPAGFWANTGHGLVVFLLAATSLAAAAVVALCLAQPLSGFALDRIVSAQERALTGFASPHPPTLGSMFRTLKATSFALGLGLPILAVLFVINWFFPPALVITLPLKFLVCAWLLAWDFLDYPLGIRRHGIRARLRWVGRHFNAFTTFGAAWAVVVVVPGIVLLLLPMGVAGATRLVIEAEGPPKAGTTEQEENQKGQPRIT